MKVLILAAGYGTRLAAVAPNTPKPLIPINNRPMIDYVIDKLQGLPSLREIVIVTNNKFYTNFQQWAKSWPNLSIKVVNDGTNSPEERLGSVGDIDFVWKQEAAHEDWLVIGGDNLFDQQLSRFISFAFTKAPGVTIGVYDIKEIAAATKFGVSTVDSEGRVIDFQEKPANPSSSLITMLLYYFPKDSIGYLAEYRKESNALDAAGSYIQWLVKTKNVYGFQFGGKWYDIGSVESLEDARKNFR